MSPGMFLRSFGFATNIYAPQRHYTLPEYCRARDSEVFEPIRNAEFARYGQWVQQQVIPEVQATDVEELRQDRGAFDITLETGEHVAARRVVVAIGLTYFERMPELFDGMPNELVSHTAQHSDFSRFNGQRVAVVGGGQSALQAAALLHEHGADVELFARHGIWFTTKMPTNRPIMERLKAPQSVLGPGRDNWLLQHLPMALHFINDDKRVTFTRRHLGPAGAWWLRDRMVGCFPTHKYVQVQEARVERQRVHLRLREPREGELETVVDHVIAGTGYEVDVNRIEFLDSALAARIRSIERAPALSSFFESSMRGLYFVGPASAFSFGPLFRFVAGAHYAAPLVAGHLALSGRFLPRMRRAAESQDPGQVGIPPMVTPGAGTVSR